MIITPKKHLQLTKQKYYNHHLNCKADQDPTPEEADQWNKLYNQLNNTADLDPTPGEADQRKKPNSQINSIADRDPAGGEVDQRNVDQNIISIQL